MIQINAPHEPATLDQPVEHLNACHRRIEQRLDTLERVIPTLCIRTEESLAAIHSAFHFFDSNGVLHTEDEEQSLFPRLLDRLNPAERAQIDALEEDHDRAHALYQHLKSIVYTFGAKPCPDLAAEYQDTVQKLTALYRSHIEREDALFPKLAALYLDDAQLKVIASEMKHRRSKAC
jgi:hemerythrin-like domain-containing protein